MLTRRSFLTSASIASIINPVMANATTDIIIPNSYHWCGDKEINWRLFYNDDLNDCTIAAMANAVLQWSTLNGQPIIINKHSIIEMYSQATGYEPGRADTDKGTYPNNALDSWKRDGWNFQRINNKLINYAIVPKLVTDVKRAIYLFGGILYESAIPSEYYNDEEGWDLTKKTNNKLVYHSIYIVGYCPKYLTFVSHGQAALMTWDFFFKYNLSSYTMLNPLWIKNGYSPLGHNANLLTKELFKFDITSNNIRL